MAAIKRITKARRLSPPHTHPRVAAARAPRKRGPSPSRLSRVAAGGPLREADLAHLRLRAARAGAEEADGDTDRGHQGRADGRGQHARVESGDLGRGAASHCARHGPARCDISARLTESRSRGTFQAGTPFAGGIFRVKVTFPADYPFKPMKVDIETKMFHPNIDDKGHMCIPMLVVRDPDAKCASSAPLPATPTPFPRTGCTVFHTRRRQCPAP